MAEEKIGKKQKNIEITQLLEEFKTAGGVHFFLTNYLDRLFVDLKKILGAS